MSLTVQNAKVILGMIAREDNHHDIAAWFGENQGRVDDVKKGKYGTLEAAPSGDLLPRGAPGLKLRAIMGHIGKAQESLSSDDKEAAARHLDDAVKRYYRNE